LEELARATKFVQREGKIDGCIFLDLIVFNSENLKEQSLNDLSIKLNHDYGIEITKQALHDRFNGHALCFLKKALEQLLKQQLPSESLLPEYHVFNRILIKDSVCFQLDESLASYYPGSGGDGSEAAIRIQFEYDLLSGNINDLSINAFNDQDSKDSIATIEKCTKGDLIVRDLAYMNLEVLRKIIELIDACFLCRLSPSVNVYEKKHGRFEKLDFLKIFNYMKNNDFTVIEKTAYLGSIDKLQVRLIIHLLPEDIVNKRLRKAIKNSKKKGRGTLGKEYKRRLSLNLFITNASVKQIPLENVWPLYRLRWQIELIFKIWKSICHIEKVKKVKKHRLECYIYSKLIFIVLGWRILRRIAREVFVRTGKAISYFKAFKTLLHIKLDELRTRIMSEQQDLKDFMIEFYNISINKHLLEKKKYKPTSLEYLLNFLGR
jgi:hypothetical protein